MNRQKTDDMADVEVEAELHSAMQKVTTAFLSFLDNTNAILERLARLEIQNSQILEYLNQSKQDTPKKKWWSPKELAEAMGCTPFTVREWCRLERIQSEKEKYSRRRRIPNREAQRLLAGGGLNPVVPKTKNHQ